jgi:hypothetical protein
MVFSFMLCYSIGESVIIMKILHLSWNIALTHSQTGCSQRCMLETLAWLGLARRRGITLASSVVG